MTQQPKLTPGDGAEDDEFGRSVAVAADDTTVLVGADVVEGPNDETGGSAYLFERSGGSWPQ